jgi:hypothetical protein
LEIFLFGNGVIFLFLQSNLIKTRYYNDPTQYLSSIPDKWKYELIK